MTTARIQASPAQIVNRSGTITLGNTAQQLMAQNTGRTGFWFQSHSANDLWISEVGTAAAAQPSLRIATNSLYESPLTGCPTSAISIFGATTGHAFSCREF